MGRSDPEIMPWYSSTLRRVSGGRTFHRVAVLGQRQHNAFTHPMSLSHDDAAAEFFDVTLDGRGRWNIEDQTWAAARDAYDLVVCTRCPYFAPDPSRFVGQCLSMLERGGLLFCDWGLGDHWRIDPYMVGWRDPSTGRQEQVEFATPQGMRWSTLSSCYWDDGVEHLERDPAAVNFEAAVGRIHPERYAKGTLSDWIRAEVPRVLTYDDRQPIDVALKAMWLSDAPQLYIATTFERA